MGRIDTLAERYKRYIALPWQRDLAGAQRIIFVVYDKADERRLRARKDLFAMATTDAGHEWIPCNLPRVFAQWMAATEYRESYFESPEHLDLKLEEDFLEHVAGQLREVLTSAKADENSVVDKVREAAKASLDRLFYEFKNADDHRWARVIERARKGTEHPLEAVDYDGKTEEHPVCSKVLSFVGSGKKGREIRAHFSAPPYGWSRDAIDAALISLFGTGHLRAATSGASLQPGQLDQGKVSRTDFRVESATIDTPQRLQLRKLFTDAKVPCKPNEETAAADEFLRKLNDLARCAGGDAPLPERPATSHLQDIRSLAGNEQLVAILNRHDELRQNLDDWIEARDLAETRLPAYERLQSLARHRQWIGCRH